MADNLIDVPDDNLANVPDTNLVDVPKESTAQPAMTAQQRYRQTLKAYHDQGTENPDVAPGYVSPETSKAFAEDKANIPQLGAQWGDVGIGAAKGLAGGLFGGLVGDIESLGRLPFQIPGVREYIADVSPHTVIPTSEEGGYLGPRGLGAFKAPENAREKAGATIGSMLSPNVLSGFYKGALSVAKGMAGQATFVGPLALETAYNAGYKGGESAKAFRESITKTAKLDEVVQEAKYSIANMREAKNADYAANMEKLSKDPTILNFDEIDKSIAAATQIDTFHGKVLLPLSDEVRKKMNGVIREWRAEDPAIFHTPAGFDALKKSLGGILEKTERGSTENKAALEIYNAVRKTIVDQAPEYASIMKAYEKASDIIRELESTFSIKNSFKRGAAQDTSLRKLQTILRDNVNASYGNREQLAQYLIANGSPHLMEKLAGQALNPYSPRGLGKLSLNIFGQIAAIAAGSMGGVPLATFLGGVAVSSPRLMGNIAYLSGVGARYGNKVPAGTAARLGSAAGVGDGTFPVETRRTIPQITIHKEPPRATGGSVFDKMHAAKHMQEGGGLSYFLEGGISGNKEGQHGGGYLGIESPTGNAGIGGQGWRENTPEGRLGRASITNVDVGHKIGDLNLTGSYRANQREIARPPAGDNTYFDPIAHSGQKFRMPNDIDKRFMLGLSKQFSDGGSVFDKMHAAKHMAEGGGTDVPFNEWDAVPRNAEGIPQIRIEKPPVNEADEAQAAREAAAARVAGNVRGAPYEPTPPSTEGKTWMMEPGKEAVQSGNYEMPPNVRLNDAGIPYNVETGEELQMARRPNVLPLTRTPDGVQWAMPKIAELAGDILNPLAVTKGVALKPGEFALGSGPIKRSVLEQPNAPTFYSALDRAVADIPQAKASAEQWAATLANRPGVKPEEIQWRGLDQYLAGRQGQTVTKQEIADHLAGNKVELGQVVKSEYRPGDVNESKYFAALDIHANALYGEPYDGLLASQQSEVRGVTLKDQNINPTKFSSYQLPGGENYSEKLMTLPYERQIKWEKTPEGHLTGGGYTIKHEPFQDQPAYITYYGNDGRRVSGNDSLKGAQNLIERSSRGVDASKAYTSPHWDEPNPVTHMRTNERTIGNTASHHIEEVQSDWHQKGRDVGYQGKNNEVDLEPLIAERERTRVAAVEAARQARLNATEGRFDSLRDALDTGDIDLIRRTRTALDNDPAYQSAIREAQQAETVERNARMKNRSGVPDAPFKKTWPDLTMKQALRDAVEGGKDRLSWTPGEAQALRYPDELRKSVSSIEWHNMKSGKPNPTGEKQILVEHKQGGGQTEFTVNKDGIVTAGPGQAVGKPINEVIGKDMSRQIMEQPHGTIDGKDFVMGAHGMTEFYDKMLPKAVEKLGKAYGVKVQRGVDTTGNPVNYVDIPPAWKQEILKKGFPLFASGGSVFDKMHAAKHMQQGGGLESFIKSLGSQGAAFGTQTEQEQAGFQRDPISELGKGAYNAVEHLAKENIDNANLLATGNRDQFSGKPGFEAGMLTMGTGAVAGVPMRAGEFALGSGPIKRAVLEQPNAPTFYSALDRAVADIPQAKAPAEQWAATLANRPGVKPEEIQWRGLDQYLAGRAGQTVTKQEIADHLAGNKVELGSVQKGLSRDNLRPDDVAKLEYGQRWQERVAMQEEIRAARPHDWWESPEFQSNQRVMDDLHNGMVDDTLARLGGEQTPTKYHGYQLPGGENYKETLLTLPSKKTKAGELPEGYQLIDENAASKAAGYNVPDDAPPRYMYKGHGVSSRIFKSKEEAIAEARKTAEEMGNAATFKSPHWDEPNPVTHMRTNERTIGNTSSHHIEEVQSDWHQKGRTEGYRNEEAVAAAEAKLQAAEKATRDGDENGLKLFDIAMRELKDATTAMHGVPDAPFKKTWPDLTMKQALRDAVENGKDRLSWTPGEAQAERYDLSKHYEGIRAARDPETGEYAIWVMPKGEKYFYSAADSVPPGKLPNYIGKDLADKIHGELKYDKGNGKEWPRRSYEGLDLKVGGEGMNEFYDKMLPKAVEKLGKAYGVKVQRGVDTTGNPVNYVDIPPAWKQEILKKGFPLFASGGSVFDKMKRASK